MLDAFQSLLQLLDERIVMLDGDVGNSTKADIFEEAHRDRFFQMDLIRRQAAGELSELFGEIAVDTDKRYRFHRFRDRSRAVLARSPAADVEILENYAAGVNAGLASLGARPFEHLLLGAEPAPWRAEDSVLVVYAMFMQLNDERARKDVRRGFLHLGFQIRDDPFACLVTVEPGVGCRNQITFVVCIGTDGRIHCENVDKTAVGELLNRHLIAMA